MRIQIENSRFNLIFHLQLILAFLIPLEGFLIYSFGSFVKIYTILFIIVSIIVLIQQRRKFYLNKRIASLLLFLSVSILSLLWTIDYNKGLYFISSMGLQALLIITISQVQYTFNQRKGIIKSYVFGTLVLSILFLVFIYPVGSFTNRFTIFYNGVLFDPNNLGVQFVLGIVFLMSLKYSGLFKNILRILLVVLFVYVVLLTASRTAILALGFFIPLYAYILYRRNNSAKRMFRFIFVTVFILLLASLLLNIDFYSIFSRFSDVTGSNRVYLWMVSRDLILRNPILGYGIGSSSTLLESVTGYNLGTHNTFITVLLELGIVGLIAFLSFVVGFLFQKTQTSDQKLYKCAVVIALISCMFLDTYNKKILWFPILVSFMNINKR